MTIGTMSGQTYDSQVNLFTDGVKPDIECETYEECVALVTIMVNFAQTFSLKQGIKRFGNKGKEAAKTEMEQLHMRNCFVPRKVNEMTSEQRKKALESLLFVTEKRDGRIKARHCANGSAQRQWMNKEDTSSPTVMLQSVFLTCAIEAKENRDVAMVDTFRMLSSRPNTLERQFL